MIKAVLFDFDDTLVKTKEVRRKAIKEAGKKFYGMTITNKDINEHWGKPLNLFVRRIFKDSENVDTLIENYQMMADKYPNEPITNTNKVLGLLNKKYLLGIISASNPYLIQGGMKDTGIDPEIFFFIQSSEDTRVHKPNPDVFSPSLEKLKSKGVGKSEVIYVGDAIDDYEASINAGFHFCAVAGRTVDEGEFKKRGIPYIKNIGELPNFIAKLG